MPGGTARVIAQARRYARTAAATAIDTFRMLSPVRVNQFASASDFMDTVSPAPGRPAKLDPPVPYLSAASTSSRICRALPVCRLDLAPRRGGCGCAHVIPVLDDTVVHHV